MTMPFSPSLTHSALPREKPAVRRNTAAVLLGASRVLHSLARRLAAGPAQPRRMVVEPVLEFHADAGAPEGALYVDGRLVGHLPGISRL